MSGLQIINFSKAQERLDDLYRARRDSPNWWDSGDQFLANALHTVIAQAGQMEMVREYLKEMSSRARRERRYGLANDLKQAADGLAPEAMEGA